MSINFPAPKIGLSVDYFALTTSVNRRYTVVSFFYKTAYL